MAAFIDLLWNHPVRSPSARIVIESKDPTVAHDNVAFLIESEVSGSPIFRLLLMLSSFFRLSGILKPTPLYNLYPFRYLSVFSKCVLTYRCPRFSLAQTVTLVYFFVLDVDEIDGFLSSLTQISNAFAIILILKPGHVYVYRIDPMHSSDLR
uniref:Uncharacterized protein n=1 Tax=Spongospora subterranea TaxID=70186 RepID=A0A0H5QZV9_9EUKA|eukprot:CRZ07435.1 hypothetical protein [Spongospora subterranea]